MCLGGICSRFVLFVAAADDTPELTHEVWVVGVLDLSGQRADARHFFESASRGQLVEHSHGFVCILLHQFFVALFKRES